MTETTAVGHEARAAASRLMGVAATEERLSQARKLLAEWVCAVGEMEGYEQFRKWSGDGPDWLRRMARETMKYLGIAPEARDA